MSKKEILINHPFQRQNKNFDALQKESQEYTKPDYLAPRRLSSYGYQYFLALKTKCQSFANIGSANFLLRDMLHSQGLYVVDSDIDINTKPSITAALPFLPFKNNAFEVILCFQVLEHLPYDLFSLCIKEMIRVGENYLIISLPDRSLSKKQRLKYSIYQVFRHPSEWKKFRPIEIDQEHFWEVGQNNLDCETVMEVFRTNNLELIEHFRNPYFDYHHFFLLKIS